MDAPNRTPSTLSTSLLPPHLLPPPGAAPVLPLPQLATPAAQPLPHPPAGSYPACTGALGASRPGPRLLPPPPFDRPPPDPGPTAGLPRPGWRCLAAPPSATSTGPPHPPSMSGGDSSPQQPRTITRTLNSLKSSPELEKKVSFKNLSESHV
jgi:hypothetical protein